MKSMVKYILELLETREVENIGIHRIDGNKIFIDITLLEEVENEKA